MTAARSAPSRGGPSATGTYFRAAGSRSSLVFLRAQRSTRRGLAACSTWNGTTSAEGRDARRPNPMPTNEARRRRSGHAERCGCAVALALGTCPLRLRGARRAEPRRPPTTATDDVPFAGAVVCSTWNRHDRAPEQAGRLQGPTAGPAVFHVEQPSGLRREVASSGSRACGSTAGDRPRPGSAPGIDTSRSTIDLPPNPGGPGRSAPIGRKLPRRDRPRSPAAR